MRKINFTLIVLFLLNACSSEYDERFKKAQELKKEYLEVEQLNLEADNIHLHFYLQELKKKINHEAKVSGNEELFLEEIWSEESIN